MKSTCFNRFGRVFASALLAATTFGFLTAARAQFVFTNNPPQSLARRPSIILIVADGLGYGDLSCYGQTKFQTPNLDKLATEGIRFTNYSVADAASPTHAALMLGKDPAHLRQRAGADIPLAPDEITVAQILKQSGYHTGLIGEWNLGDENSSGAPWKKGFDEFAGYFSPAGAENFYADYIFRYAPRSFLNSTNNQMDDFAGKEMIYPNTLEKKTQYIPDLFATAAVNFVKNNQPDPFNHYRPFFLLVNYQIPGRKIEVPTDAPFSEEPWPQAQKNKAALITRIDGYVGQLREQLQKIGMTNNVVIFFSSASVPSPGGLIDPGFFHSTISTNDFRAPMIACWSGTIPAGQVSGLKWSARHFLPTAAGIALAKPPAHIDGTSVLPALLGQPEK